jgi:hypothetical protein
MTRFRFVVVVSLAGCVMIAAGCRTLGGSACLKALPDEDVQEQASLRIPVGLDPVDTSAALKVPPAGGAIILPVPTRCLEDPPLIQPLPDPVAAEKEEKRRARKSSREARDARPPGPRLTN